MLRSLASLESYTRSPLLMVRSMEDEETQSCTELTANFVDVWTLTIALMTERCLVQYMMPPLVDT